MEEQNQITTTASSALMAVATNVAESCKKIVEASHVVIQKRKYVKVEGWQAIANGFGCVASARDVTKVFDEASGEFAGFRAIGEVRRQSDGVVLATGEGFVGVDEPTWFGGIGEVWNNRTRKFETKNYKARAEYGVRAMAQTRAISRACRAAFAFVVVMINKDFSTTPAEEVSTDDAPYTERSDEPTRSERPASSSEPKSAARWEDAVCSFGKKEGKLRGKKLGELTAANLNWLYEQFVDGKNFEELSAPDKAMVIGLKKWKAANGQENNPS